MNLDATISPAAAAARRWDVLVVGAGPAGGMAALLLARRGVRVLLVERAAFPRYKVCGGCLSRGSVNRLEEAGLADRFWAEGAVPLEALRLHAGHRSAEISLPAGASLSRARLDAMLVRAAIEAGADWLPETEAKSTSSTTAARRLTIRHDGDEAVLEAGVLIAADGLNGQLLRGSSVCDTAADSRIGAGMLLQSGSLQHGDGQPLSDPHPDVVPHGTVIMACAAGGYVGLVRAERRQLMAAASLDVSWVREAGGVQPAVRRVLNEAGLAAASDIAEFAWRGTPRLTRQATQVAGHRFFVLGDAAGYVEPFTGEGIAWALSCGAAVVPLAEEANRRWSEKAADRWTSIYATMVRRRQWTCWAVSRGLRHVRLLQACVAVLGRLPGLAQPVVHRVTR